MKPKQPKSTGKKPEKGKSKGKAKWIVTIFCFTVLISSLFSFGSSMIFNHAGILPASLVLLLIVLIGIFFDMIGVAVTAADTKPFNAMAAHREPGGKEALKLISNADKVASFCNDVVGDICGVVSGIASASLVLLIVAQHTMGSGTVDFLEILLAALVSGLTVGGKAIGKTIAMQQSTSILHLTGRVIYQIKHIPKLISKLLHNKKSGRD